MNVAVDIGNTRLKCGFFIPEKEICVYQAFFLPKRHPGDKTFYRSLLEPKNWKNAWGNNLRDVPITWQIAPTGNFSLCEFQNGILEVKPRDQFQVVTRQDISLDVNVDSPETVGIDRLLAAFAAVMYYDDAPMLIVDAGSAITVDVVKNQTFCGGAILPGLVSLSESYPKISGKLPVVPVPFDIDEHVIVPTYPGKNTNEAIRSGYYWGIIGAIRQFYTMSFHQKDNALLVLTGGDGHYLFQGLNQVISSRLIKQHELLVLEGIYQYFAD